MKKAFLTLLVILTTLSVFSQSTGDTIVVPAFNYNMTYQSGSRDTMAYFPTDTSLTFEKILLYYNMRCKDGVVNTSGSVNNIGCGAWDYTCNTHIYDSTRVDSMMQFTSSHSISNFSGTTFNYSAIPIFDYYLSIQQNVVVDSIISEAQSVVGAGNLMLDHTFPTDVSAGKSQYLYTQSELTAAGIIAGNIDGLLLNVLNAGYNTDYLRIRIKHTLKTELDNTSPDLSGFAEVYYSNTIFTTGSKRLQFYTPFMWDGTSNIIVEFTFTNSSAGTAIEIEGENTSNNYGMYSAGDKYFDFNGVNYLESNSYKGISANNDRTIEAWINSKTPNKEIVSWGLNAAQQKWVFRINDNGTVRVEVNGGNVYGTTRVDDGLWHHVACIFSGTDVAQVMLYVDGVYDPVGGSAQEPVNTNTTTGINLRVSRGTNERYFIGAIDEVRVWSAALSIPALQEWMYRSVDATHPNYSSLETYFQLNEGSGTSITDNTTYNRDATVINGETWGMIRGIDLFKEFQLTTERPNTTFLQGTYNMTVTGDTLLDSLQAQPNVVIEYEIIHNYGSFDDDDVSVLSTNYYWEALYYYIFDQNGIKIDSMPITPTGTINITELNYYSRFPSKYQIMSFVTPYGAYLDMGMEGKTWIFDVTDFSPILKEGKRITVSGGGQWQEDMDIKFHFIVGTPPRDVIDMQQLWPDNSTSYTNILNNRRFEPKDVMMNPDAFAYKIRSSITGHGQQGEFIPRSHFIDIDGGADDFIWTVWKECASNPVYPQGGTWIYDRAGWCPGMATDVREWDLTPLVTPGQSHIIDYGLYTASGSSNYIVSNQLVSYGDVNFINDAAVVEVLEPSNRIEYFRTNPMCSSPKVVIQNNGRFMLTNLTIEYWVNDATTHESYTWTGVLANMQKETVALPLTSTLWSAVSGVDDKFHVLVKDPNSGVDEYSYNDTYTSDFAIPDVIPSNFIMLFKTNNAADESAWYLQDDMGNTLFARNNMTNSTLYLDTFNLSLGCYKIVITDTDDDGIDFWNNNDGTGLARIMDGNGSIIRTFEGDFGRSFIYNFTIDIPLTYEELNNNWDINVYPNPAVDEFFVEAKNIHDATINIMNSMGQLVNIPSSSSTDRIQFNTTDIPKGVYFVNIKLDDKTESRTIVVE